MEATFQHSHIDRMPLGALSTVFLQLSVTHPDIHWTFRYTARNHGAEEAFTFDDKPVKEALGDSALTHPDGWVPAGNVGGRPGNAQSLLTPATKQEI